MLHLIQIFLLTQTVQATQVSAFYIVWLIALCSEGRAPVTHATSYPGKNMRSDVGDSVFYAKNSFKAGKANLENNFRIWGFFESCN